MSGAGGQFSSEFSSQPGGGGASLSQNSPYAALMGGGSPMPSSQAPAAPAGIDYSQNQWQQPNM